MENPADKLLENIFYYFLRSKYSNFESNKINLRHLVRFNNEKLSQFGDLCFRVNPNVWKQFLNINAEFLDGMFNMFKDPKTREMAKYEFLVAANKWKYPIERLDVEGDRCSLYFQRNSLITNTIKQVIGKGIHYGCRKKNLNKCIYFPRLPIEVAGDDLSLIRAKFLRETLQKVLWYSEWVVLNEYHDNNIALDSQKSGQDVYLKLQVISAIDYKNLRHNLVKDDKSLIVIKCGIVCPPKSRKRAKITLDNYLSLRLSDITRAQKEDHIIPIKKDDAEDYTELNVAAVTVDLLSVKHSSPAKYINNGQGCNRGAPFILYNYARIYSLLSTFNERVRKFEYAPLPPLDEVDFTLLVLEEEWQLIFVNLFLFPNLLERCIENVGKGICAVHLIIRFLDSLVAVFSKYYSRNKILTTGTNCSMPLIYARIYLLKALQLILIKTLALLNIDPPTEM